MDVVISENKETETLRRLRSADCSPLDASVSASLFLVFQKWDRSFISWIKRTKTYKFAQKKTLVGSKTVAVAVVKVSDSFPKVPPWDTFPKSCVVSDPERPCRVKKPKKHYESFAFLLEIVAI